MQGDQKIGNAIGRLGEDIACLYLESKKFDIIGRNYRKKWGEIDIIAKKVGIAHFVEVKTTSGRVKENVTPETNDRHRAEDNLHTNKVKRLKRAISSYLAEKNFSPETKWIFDAITVRIDSASKKAQIHMLENVIL
ncbi:MAG: hypothetical protein A3H57_04615 [Candidatus Taylorbacteria bacterium RIFCSPLOWO2_02_FULL_43_11]|uniref:UPF0102 protein A3C72_00125 n=1 Tax=Candidatus Taylorbacteria bacterium RIFCSPHIGHO2_02_FULL_43_32b TaxID=1802306 RepID=A0A1G2MH22_9BACT|nr:MAG: hypothetical protein A3C72_00125 [Candidatus Taylorbacteria bacterium RIFCSPHIGHO2_02_FULL_43_32b]OHA30032.1 MAG: hypothetical protein A3B08_01015 [Candidatus Taylorbacteria bacterium RIFCSPLOWO2_01_FULL_43_44]OHA35609.1 MAG: hypothetical protein A3H57_04615 [Candidatus Taylorbacteria bacterium RIFCSPLOWO2_02_FULL_43_11]